MAQEILSVDPSDRQIRFLDILFDENLSSKHHISQIKMKISRNFGTIRKLKYTFPGSKD